MLFVRALALGLLVAGSSAASAQPHFSAYQVRLLNAHNLERRAIGAAPLVWDARLATAAGAYAAQLARTGRWTHAPASQRPDQGENLWMGTRGAYPPEGMVRDWASGKRHFRPGIFPNVSRTGSWHDVGHYTQVVWPTTRRVGCALRSNARHDYLVCRYSSPGNVAGQPVFTGRRVASR